MVLAVVDVIKLIVVVEVAIVVVVLFDEQIAGIVVRIVTGSGDGQLEIEHPT